MSKIKDSKLKHGGQRRVSFSDSVDRLFTAINAAKEANPEETATPKPFLEALAESKTESTNKDYFLSAVRESKSTTQSQDDQSGPTPAKGVDLYHSISQYHEEKVCLKCKGLIVKDENETNWDEVPHAVTSALHKLNYAVQKRRKLKTKEKLDEIMARVNCALQDSEMSEVFSGSSTTNVSSEENIFKFNQKNRWKKKTKRRKVVTQELLSTAEISSEQSRFTMMELEGWFKAAKTNWDKISEMHDKAIYSGPDFHINDVIQLVEQFEESTSRLNFLFNDKIVPALRKPRMARVPAQRREVESDDGAYTSDVSTSGSEDSLLGLSLDRHVEEINKRINLSPRGGAAKAKPASEKMKGAFHMIKQSLNFGKRVAKSKKFKQTFNNTKNRLKWITAAIEQREKEKLGMEKDLDKKKKKIIEMEKEQKKENEEKLFIIHQVNEKNNDLRVKINDLEIELANKVSAHSVNLKEESNIRIPSAVSFKSDLPVPKVSEMRQRSRSVIETRQELSQSQNEDVIALQQVIKTLELQVQNLTGVNEELKSKTTMLENNALKLEDELKLTKSANEKKEEEIEKLTRERRISIDKSSRLSADKNELEAKNEKLQAKYAQAMLSLRESNLAKNKVERNTSSSPTGTCSPSNERSVRARNTISKVAHNQVIARLKKQWNADVNKLRRFIISEQNRFQASLKKVQLDHKKQVEVSKAGNIQVMKALHRFKTSMSKLIAGETNNDGPYQMAPMKEEGRSLYDRADHSNFSESAVEILTRLERSLEVFVLSKSMKLRDANAITLSTEKKFTEKSFHLGKVERKLEEKDAALKTIYEDKATLSNECKKLLVTNQQLTKNLEIFQKSKSELPGLCSGDYDADEYLNEGKKDYKRVITHLIKQNVLTRGDLQTAKDIVQHMGEVNVNQLALIFRRYVHFRKIIELKEHIISTQKEYGDDPRFNEYLTMANERYQDTIRKIQLERLKLQKKKANLFLAFGELLRRGNKDFLSVLPLAKKGEFPTKDKSKHERYRSLAPIQKRRLPLEDLIGRKLVTGKDEEESFWQIPTDLPSINRKIATITTPKILDMDVNPWRKIIQIASQKGDCRMTLPPIATVYTPGVYT